MCLRLDSTEIPIIADTTTPKLVKLESKKKSRKILVWKEIKEKEKWNKKSKVLIREYLVAYYYYDIVVDFRALLISLFWFDPNNIFFFGVSHLSHFLRRFFSGCVHTKHFNESGGNQSFFLFFFQHVLLTLAHYNCQFNKISQYFTHRISVLPVLQVFGARTLTSMMMTSTWIFSN